MAPLAAGETDGLPVPQRYWAHLAVGLAVAMSVMDGSIANVALPTIARDLHSSPVSIIWVVNAFQLAVCVSLMVLGSLGDIHGYARVYRWCLVVFTLSSLACALSTSLMALSIARFFQGVGGAGLMGVTNALLRGIYPRRELAVGIGRNTLILALALVTGPTVASAILSVATWPYLFAVNVPIGIVALVVGGRVLPKTGGSGHPFDARSAQLNVLAFGLLVLAIEGFGHGEPGAVVAAEFAAGGVALAALIRRQRAVASPLLPVDLLRIRLFALSVGTTFLASMAQIIAYVAIPFLFQQELGLSQVRTGLLITPWPVMVGLVGPFAGKLAGRFPASLLSSAGLAIFALAMLLLARLSPGAGTADIVWRIGLAGIGYGLFLPPNASTQISAAPKSRSGGASTMGGTARVLGQAIGSAAVALLFGLVPMGGASWSLVAASVIALAGVAVSASRRARR
jgi:DHA2 family multidrug resistance protein-like MFS transporter